MTVYGGSGTHGHVDVLGALPRPQTGQRHPTDQAGTCGGIGGYSV